MRDKWVRTKCGVDRRRDVHMRADNVREYSVISSDDRSDSLNNKSYRGSEKTRII